MPDPYNSATAYESAATYNGVAPPSPPAAAVAAYKWESLVPPPGYKGDDKLRRWQEKNRADRVKRRDLAHAVAASVLWEGSLT